VTAEVSVACPADWEKRRSAGVGGMPSDRQALFDEWATSYGIDAEQASRFPFLGYHDVLSQVAGRVALTEPARVIELGAGTGTLTSLIRGLLPAAELVAVDFSQPMLDRLEN